MKSKKRHHTSSDESEESNISDKSSSSDSDSDESSESDHRYKKKKKHAGSSDSDSHSDDQKRTKKRKHKKKKKKHGKKKRRSESVISDDNFSISDDEIAPKKKKKHKHKNKRSRASTASEDEEPVPRRLHSVVKEPRASSGDGSHPSRTYYQKEYRRSASVEIYDEREQEVQRFYRGSSKEHKYHRDDYNYDRQHNDRIPQHNDRYDRNREKYGQSGRYDNPNADQTRQRNYDEFKRPRYEDRRPDEYSKRPREDTYYREDARANDRYNQYEGPKRREFNDNRDYRERRAPPEPTRYREREFVDKREKPRDEPFSPERNRDMRRERPGRPDKPQFSHQREPSRSPDERYKERNKRGDERVERMERVDRVERVERVERVGREGREEREERRERRGSPRRSALPDNKPPQRERKSRFTDVDDSKEYSWGKADVKKEGNKGTGDKEKPNFGLSGKLTADANTVNGVVIKYREPDDAKQPKRRWRFYPFKGDKALPILYIHRQSCFLLGRDKLVADIPLEHPSVSKQHAVLQYRATPFTRDDGSQGRRVRPYIIDLESANGTFVNNKKIEPRRYVELLERDVVKFGFSQREYVLLHENSKDDAQDDDQEPAPDTNVTTTDQIKIDKRIKEEIAADGD